MWPTPNLIRRASEGLSFGPRKAVSNDDKWLKLVSEKILRVDVPIVREIAFSLLLKVLYESCASAPLRGFAGNPFDVRFTIPIGLLPDGGIDCVKW